MPGYRSVPVWRSIGWVAALGALTAILVLAILQVNSPAQLDIRRSYQVRSGVDGLQLYVGQGWRRTVRLGAVLISGVLGVIWVRFLNIYPNLSVAYILSGLILGGFISWFLRDLVAIVERIRS